MTMRSISSGSMHTILDNGIIAGSADLVIGGHSDLDCEYVRSNNNPMNIYG